MLEKCKKCESVMNVTTEEENLRLPDETTHVYIREYMTCDECGETKVTHEQQKANDRRWKAFESEEARILDSL